MTDPEAAALRAAANFLGWLQDKKNLSSSAAAVEAIAAEAHGAHKQLLSEFAQDLRRVARRAAELTRLFEAEATIAEASADVDDCGP